MRQRFVGFVRGFILLAVLFQTGLYVAALRGPLSSVFAGCPNCGEGHEEEEGLCSSCREDERQVARVSPEKNEENDVTDPDKAKDGVAFGTGVFIQDLEACPEPPPASPSGQTIPILNPFLYALDILGAERVFVFDRRLNAFTGAIPLNVSAKDLVCSYEGKLLYVVYAGFEFPGVPTVVPGLAAVDVVAKTVLWKIDLSARAVPWGIAVSPDDHWAYVSVSERPPEGSTQSNHIVVVVDLLEKRIAGTIAVRRPPGPSVLTPDGALLFVTTNQSTPSEITVIDTLSRTVSATIPVIRGTGTEIVMHPNGTRAYIAPVGGFEGSFLVFGVAVIDTATARIIDSFPVREAEILSPNVQMAMQSRGERLYLVDGYSDLFLEIDPNERTVVKQTQIERALTHVVSAP